LERRLEVASRAFHKRKAALMIASGGRAWNGVLEADFMAARLAVLGVPERDVLRERCSFDTVQNARYCAAILARRPPLAVCVVTCDWLLPRALAAFRRAGVAAEGVPAYELVRPSALRRAARAAREWGALRLAAATS
jgi:hypothetical protein